MKITKSIVLFLILYQNGYSQSLREEIYSKPKAIAERLNEAYSSGDLKSFDIFFESWHEWSLERDSLNKDSFTVFVDSIFQLVYFPFDHKQYGWQSSKSYEGNRYAIVQTTIPYCFRDSIYSKSLDSLVSCSYDSRAKPYYSSIELNKKKIVYDDIYYGSVLRMFFEGDGFAKRIFIGNWIKLNSSHRQFHYLTSPTIIGLQINENRTKVVAHLSLDGTEFFLNLSKRDGIWTTEILPFQIIHD